MALMITSFFLQVVGTLPVGTPVPTLASVPLSPILWSLIVFLASLLVGLCMVVINIVKSRFLAIEQNNEKLYAEILKINNDIKELQHGQEMFSKDLKIKDMMIENVRLQNRLHEGK